MESVERNKLTTSDIARRLNVTETTVYRYIRQDKIIPLNKDSWNWDGQYFFYEDEVDFDSLQEDKPGLTTGEVAKMLGTTTSTILRYIKEGRVKGFKELYKGRMYNFIEEEEVKAFMSDFKKKKKYKKKSFYSKHEGYGLFHHFFNADINKAARIISLSDDEIIAMTEDGEKFEINELIERGYSPTYIIEEKNLNTKKGYALFRFTKPRQIQSTTYKIIDLFYQLAGPLNIRLMEEEDMLQLETRQILMKIDKQEHMDEINMLQQSLVEGKIKLRHNGVSIESNLEVQVLNLPSSLKKKLKERANQEQLSMDDLIVGILNREVE